MQKIKFSEVNNGQLFTFSYYDKRDCPIQKGFMWVFLKFNETDFITIDSFFGLVGTIYSYEKDDDSPCILLSASFDILE